MKLVLVGVGAAMLVAVPASAQERSTCVPDVMRERGWTISDMGALSPQSLSYRGERLEIRSGGNLDVACLEYDMRAALREAEAQVAEANRQIAHTAALAAANQTLTTANEELRIENADLKVAWETDPKTYVLVAVTLMSLTLGLLSFFWLLVRKHVKAWSERKARSDDLREHGIYHPTLVNRVIDGLKAIVL